MTGLVLRPLIAGDAVLLELQESQSFEFGVRHSQFTLEEGEALALAGPAWTAARGSKILGIAGFREVFPGHAVLWAALSAELGRDHLACTRFARDQVEAAPYHRLEALVSAENERAVAWARLVGLTPGYTLHGYGAAAKPHILFEKVKLNG